MWKRFICILFIPIFVLFGIIVKPMSVYAFKGYDYEYYLSNMDEYEELTSKEKIYVALDQFLSGSEGLEWYVENSDSAIAACFGGVVWAIAAGTGLLTIDNTWGDVYNTYTDTLAGLVDDEEIYEDDDGNIVISSDAVNEIRSEYVEDYRIVEIGDQYNTFCFGWYWDPKNYYYYDGEDSWTDLIESGLDIANFTNISMFSEYAQTIADIMVPATFTTSDPTLSYPASGGYNRAILVYRDFGSDVYHISEHASEESVGYMYSEDTDYPLIDILVNTESYDSTSYYNFYFNDSNSGVTPLYSRSLNLVVCDETSDGSVWYWSENSDLYTFDSDTLVSLLYNIGFNDDSGWLYSENYETIINTVGNNIPYRTYTETDSSTAKYKKYVQVSTDTIIVDDTTGDVYSYNSGGGHYGVNVSRGAYEDATDGDDTNSPSIIMPADQIVNIINNYENIINEIEEDNSLTNVQEVINYYMDVDDSDEDDSGSSGSDDSGSSGSSGSDDSDDSGSGSYDSYFETIISYLKKIYNKLCSLYDYTVGYLYDIRSNTADIVDLVSGLYDSYSSVQVDISGLADDLDDVKTSLSSIVQNTADISGIYTRIGNVYYMLSDIYDDLSVLGDSVNDIGYFTEGLYDNLCELNDSMADVIDLLGDIYSALGTISSRTDTIRLYVLNIYNTIYSYITGYLQNIQNTVEEINDYIPGIYSGVVSLGSAISDVSDAIADANTYLSGIYNRIGSVYYLLSDLNDNIVDLYDYVSLYLSDLDYLEPMYGYLGEIKEVTENINNLIVTLQVDLYEALSYLALVCNYFTGNTSSMLTDINNLLVEIRESLAGLPDSLGIADLFSEYFMDSFYVSQTVFEIMRGDLEMIYDMLVGNSDSILSEIRDAIQDITVDGSDIGLGAIKAELAVISGLLTGIAALLAVDTVVDLLDFTDDQLDDYMDSISGALSSVADNAQNVFPFSIPWDLLAILALFSAEPEAPVIDYPFQFDRLGIDYTIHIDLSQFETVATICRTLLTCLFVCGLGYLTIRITQAGGGDGD